MGIGNDDIEKIFKYVWSHSWEQLGTEKKYIFNITN